MYITLVTLVHLEVILKVGTITTPYRFVQKDINTATSCQNIFGH